VIDSATRSARYTMAARKKKKRRKPPSKQRRWKITCSEDTFNRLKSDERFLGLLTLARFVNALRFCEVTFLKAKGAKTPSARRQSINGFLFASSVLYEGFLLVGQLGKRLRNFESYKSGFGPLFRDPAVKSLRKNYLKRLRNKFVFHFDQAVPGEVMDQFDLPEYAFATGRGPRSSELYFDLADEIFIDYLLPLKKGEVQGAHDERHKAKIKEVSEVANRFSSAAESLIAEVLPTMGWTGHYY
jgi:hypothetical protein